MVKVAFRKRVLSKSSRARCLRRDQEGIASVIGTIMALLIFMTLLTMFVNTYIPIWMKENERLHMNEVQTQMSEVKGRIDNLIVGAEITGTNTVSTYEPITMGADGIPLFASPTAGVVILKPTGTFDTGVNLKFNYTTNGNQIVKVNENGGGKLEFYAPNRYYVGQWLAYENGALIVKQDQGEAMKATPSLKLTNLNNTINIGFTQIDIQGINSTMAGTGIAGVNINLIYLDTETYALNQNSIVFKFTTVYNSSLVNFLNSTAKSANLVYNSNYTLTDTAASGGSGVHTITFKITPTGKLTLGTFTLNRAYVDIGISV